MTSETGSVAFDAFFARRGLDEVRAGHHRHPTGACYVAQGHQVAGAQDGFHVSRARGLFERRNLVVERLPLALKTCARVMTMSISCAPASTLR